MGNIMDYISWRGDLSFEQSQFNEVDNLILACFSYVNLDGISAVTKQKGIGLKKLTKEFMKLHTMKELEADKSFIRLAPFMMMKMAKSVRFGKCVVRNYVNDKMIEICEEMLSGEVKIEPCKSSKVTYCDYCDYSAICQFDTSIRDNKYKIILKKKKDDLWNAMENKVKEEESK